MADSQRGTAVSVLGLGVMGSALARALLDTGHSVTVWNRTAAKTEDLVVRGAVRASDVETALASSSVVVVCIGGHDAVRQLLAPHVRLVKDRTLVNVTSGTSQSSRELSDWLSGCGADYLSGALIAVPPTIGTPDAVVIYSGSEQAYVDCRGTLSAFATDTRWLGSDPGLASLYDTALLGLMWNTMNGFLHATAMLTAAGAEARSLAPLARLWTAQVSSWFPDMADCVDAEEHVDDDATMETHVAALQNLVNESAALGIGTEFPIFLKQLTERAIAMGQHQLGYTVLVDRFRRD